MEQQQQEQKQQREQQEQEHKIPLIYHPNYEIDFYGLERSLPITQSGKTIFNILSTLFNLTLTDCTLPIYPITDDDLLLVHTKTYLISLKTSSFTIASIMRNTTLLALLPMTTLQSRLLQPMKWIVSGTILAIQTALIKGWSIHLSGGYHHAHADHGENGCIYADIALGIYKVIQEKRGLIGNILIIDCMAHQGYGLITSYLHRDAKGDNDLVYLDHLQSIVPEVLQAVHPALVIYLAGYDIHEDDSIGGLAVTSEGIIARDAWIFRCCRAEEIPIAMILSLPITASKRMVKAAVDSIRNLHEHHLISLTKSNHIIHRQWVFEILVYILESFVFHEMSV
eukprot:gene5365-5901_t